MDLETGSAGGIAIVDRAFAHDGRVAIVDGGGAHTYRESLGRSARVAARLLDGRPDLEEGRVAFLVPRGVEYTAVQWGIWRAGGVAVPLCDVHPQAELAYTIEDCGAEIVVGHGAFEDRLRPVAEQLRRRYLPVEHLDTADVRTLPQIDPARRAMIIYTSGTTGRPKGAVTTHLNTEAQIETLVEAWDWRAEDHVLHVLPLHHVHGIINILSCALWVGARCTMLPRFEPETVWNTFMESDVSVFMAVPTVYVRLIEFWEASGLEARRKMSEAASALRLMVSGSAALPVSVFEKWRAIAGQSLLERYGMTEIGMALSNPVHGERLPGRVGAPLKGVEVRLVDEERRSVPEGVPGEIQVRGPGVFREYWGRPEETRAAFRDGWFATGDVAVVENGVYRILGRLSTDIIKTGGYKISALEVEEVYRSHPAVKEVAVVGAEDPTWGERVCAGVVLESGTDVDSAKLRNWGKERMAPYKVPSLFRFVDELPRNPLGKVIKPSVKKLFE